MNKLFVLLPVLVALAIAGAVSGRAKPGEWVCPPCSAGSEGHCEKIRSKPGRCPECGMPLIEKDRQKKVGILLFDGVQIIDFTGPYEVFGQVREFEVFTVSETGDTITTAMNMNVTPTHSFETAPRPEILVVPGGGVHRTYENDRVIEWIRDRAASAEHVLSVCNGAFILAKAGLLDGKSATTFYGLLDRLQSFRPQVEVVDDQRFVDNGKVITSAGLSSGIDASLYLVSKLHGMQDALALARHLEYDWDPESGYARAALADLNLPDVGFPDEVATRTIASSGDRDSWTVEIAIETSMSLEELTSHIDRELKAAPDWTRDADRTSPAEEHRSYWFFVDRHGAAWNAVATVEATGEQEFVGTLSIRKAPEDRT